MRIYIAAKYSRREELRGLLARVEALGHECTSTWIRNGEDSEAQWRESAELDVADVRRAEALLFVGQPRGSENRGGGRWFEFGLAWGAGKRCLAVIDGGHESVFTHLPGVEVYDSTEDALMALGTPESAR